MQATPPLPLLPLMGAHLPRLPRFLARPQLPSPRQNYLYSSAELTRPCFFEISFISNHATQQRVETSAGGKPTYANLRGYDEPIRSAYIRTEVNKIMTRFVSSPRAPNPSLRGGMSSGQPVSSAVCREHAVCSCDGVALYVCQRDRLKRSGSWHVGSCQ
jgi:hypothetical protein